MSDNISVDRRLHIFREVHPQRREVDELLRDNRCLRVVVAVEAVVELLRADGIHCRTRGAHLVQTLSDAPFGPKAIELVNMWNAIGNVLGGGGLRTVVPHYKAGDRVEVTYDWMLVKHSSSGDPAKPERWAGANAGCLLTVGGKRVWWEAGDVEVIHG